MKRKDDDLLRLAFGEMSDDAAHAVEAKADASERAEIAAFRRLREGLDQMPTPPPDGLSAERLRAAILDGELRDRRRPVAWSNLLFASAALAAIVILTRLRPHAEPQLVGMESPRLGALRTPTFDFSTVVAKNETRSALPVAKATLAPRSASSHDDVAVRHSRRHRMPILVVPYDPGLKDALVYVAPADELPSGAVSAPETIAPPPSKVVDASPGMVGKTETVVLVSSKRDLETGAPAATEKEAASVLVGG